MKTSKYNPTHIQDPKHILIYYIYIKFNSFLFLSNNISKTLFYIQLFLFIENDEK